MAFNTNIKITPQKGGLLSSLSQIGSGIAEQANENFSNFFNDWMEEKKAREKELIDMIEQLKEKEPLEETSQKRSNAEIQDFIGEIAKMKEKNRKAGSFSSWTDEDSIRIKSKFKQLSKKFDERTRMGKMFEKAEAVVNKDMGKTIDRGAFYDVELEYWETDKYPEDEDGNPVPLFTPMPKDYEAEFVRLNNTRGPRKKFKEYRNGMAIDVWTYDVDDTQRRDAAIGLLSDEGLRKGADMMFGRLDDAEDRKQAAVSQGVNPTEVYLAEKAENELWQDIEVPRPLTAAEREALGLKGKTKVETVSRQGDTWQMYDDPVKLTGFKGSKTSYVTSLIYGKPPGTTKEGKYFEVYKTTDEVAEVVDSTMGREDQLFSALIKSFSPSQYTVEYVPYEELKSMVEKKYNFEGIQEYKKMEEPASNKPKENSFDFSTNIYDEKTNNAIQNFMKTNPSITSREEAIRILKEAGRL